MQVKQRANVFVLNMQIVTLSICSMCVREGDRVRMNVKSKMKE